MISNLSGSELSSTLGARFDDVRSHPFSPMPDVDGSMLVDPEISLKAMQFNLAINLSYSTSSLVDRELGVGRSATIRAYIAKIPMSIAGPSLVRGDLQAYSLSLTSTSGTVESYVGASQTGYKNTLSYDTATGLWTEFFPDGLKIEYSEHVASGPMDIKKFEISRVVHQGGAVQTYTYGTGTEAGLIKNIEAPGGRKVTLAYTASSPVPLLSTIQDWGGRTWTLAYDASRYLTTFTAPMDV